MTFDRLGSDAAERDRAYTAMLANISDVIAVIAVINGEGINRFKSPNVLDLFGWSPEELVGKPMLDKVHPDDRSEMQAIFAQLMQNPDGTITGECRYRHGDGHYRWIRFTAANKLADPILQGVLLNYRDITGERRVRERFRTTFEAAPVGMILADDSNTVIEANRAAERMLGYGPGELTGINGREIIHPDDLQAEAIETVTERILERPDPLELENRFRTKSGEYLDVNVRAGPIDLEDQSASHIVQFYDVSRRKRAEQRVQTLLDEKELLLREVHHRIKNDLSLVQSLLSTQARTVTEDAAAALQGAAYRVGVIARVYDRLQGLSSLDDVSISAVVGGLVDELRAGLVPDDVAVRVQVQELNVPARLAVSLGIIVNELITNGVKYAFTTAEKEVTVVVSGDAAGGLLLTVSDTGGGFPADVLSGARLGYGLTITGALVAQHQGTMVLRNDDGGIVEIRVPAAGSSLQR